MLLIIIFFCVALNLPLAAAFDTKNYLNDELLSSLPEDVATLAWHLRDLLESNPCLHFDGTRTWGPEEIWLFSEKYFPTLQELVVAAAQEPTLIKESRANIRGERVVRLLGLGRALEHLLAVQYHDGALVDGGIFGVAGAIPGTVLSLKIARSKFMTLRGLVVHWLLRGLPDMDASEGDRSLQAATISPMIKITCLGNITDDFNMAIRGVAEIYNVAANLEAVDVVECPLVEQELQALIDELKYTLRQQREFFNELQGALNNLFKFGGSRFQLSELFSTWSHSGCRSPLDFPSALPPPDDARFKMLTLQRQAITLANRQLALLAGEIVLLRLQLAKSTEPDCAAPQSHPSSPENCSMISEFAGREKSNLWQIGRTISKFVASHKSSSAEKLMGKLADWPSLDRELYVQNLRATTLLKQVKIIMDPQNESIMQLDTETLEALKDIYDPIKQIVQAYAAILELGMIKGLEPSQMGQLLTTIFKSPEIRVALPLYKRLMERMGAVFAAWGVAYEAYDWKTFPLRFILHPPGSKSAASGAVSEEGIGRGRRRAPEEGAESETKSPGNRCHRTWSRARPSPGNMTVRLGNFYRKVRKQCGTRIYGNK